MTDEERSARRNEQKKAWSARNPDYHKKYIAANIERRREVARDWARRNPDVLRENKARWKAADGAIPSWSDKEVMRSIYAIARAWRSAGVDAQVDHIVPLRSRRVTGFHSESNLTIVPATENQRKNNKRWPDMPTD